MKKELTIFDKIFGIVGIVALIVITIGAFISEGGNQQKQDYSVQLMEQSLQLQQEQIEILKNLEVKIKIGE